MPRITELYAWVMADADEDDEGVPGFSWQDWMVPMMGADGERAADLRPMAQGIANESGKPIKLIRSTAIEIVEVVQPARSYEGGEGE